MHLYTSVVRVSLHTYQVVGHIAKFCPQKAQDAGTENPAATAAAATTTINNKQPSKEEQGPGQGQPKTNNPEGWTEVARRKKKSPKSGDSIPATISPVKTTKEPTKNQQQNHQKAQDQHQLQHQNHQHQQLRQKRRKKKQHKNQWRPRWIWRGGGRVEKGPPKKFVRKSPILRQAPPLMPSRQLHCNQHHHHPLHNAHNKWTCPLPNKNLTPQNRLLHMNCFLKNLVPTKFPPPRSQSAERTKSEGLARTSSLPSLSPSSFSSQELFPASPVSPRTPKNPPARKK